MTLILWIIAVILVIAGIVQLFQRQLILGIVLIVLGFLVGPGGVSIFSTAGLAIGGLWPVRLTDLRRRLGHGHSGLGTSLHG